MKAIFATLIALSLPLSLIAQKPEAERPNGGVVDFLQPIEPDPLIQHSKEVYVRNGCAYCHGVDLRVRNGEAANLMNSSIVAGDVDGNVIGPLLRHGIPQTAKLSPMPQFSDLSDRNLIDIARWIHYARQQGRYAEVMAAASSPGDATRGKAAFTERCVSCHSTTAATALARKIPAAELRARMLKPPSLNGVQSYTLQALEDTQAIAARRQHGTLLENSTPQSTADLAAYLTSLR